MILDSSALAAILFQEQFAERLLEAMERAGSLSVGAPTVTETSIVIGSSRLGYGTRVLSQLLQHFEVATVPFGELHAEEARRAYQKFGKGRHPAGLNFGDCMSYATASLAREPLLCVGDDFGKTDLELAKF